jgi:energy-coupling factor transporter ATP-binding protein EcfA2
MAMLSTVRIRNYRCFADHTVDFAKTSIIVGRNNAGKSTLIEALRLISIALKRFSNPVSAVGPDWLDDFAPGNGQRINLSTLGVWSRTIFHRYGDPPAIIEAGFDDDSKLTLYIGPDGEGHTIFVTGAGNYIRRRSDLGQRQLPKIAILPQIVPVEREELVLVPEYVRQNLDSHLASRHFRNQLNLLAEYFEPFRMLVEDSWPGIRINDLIGQGAEQGDHLELMIRDGNFVAEAGWMGHGLQIWLQTIWFVTRTRDAGTLVLDEPDVYMHPDLQRRLVRFLLRQRAGLIVATHSTEILMEVDATSVLVLDRDCPRSSFAADLPAVQKVIESIGSAQNLQIARLWRAKALILVEGDDMKILKRIHDVLLPDRPVPLDAVPNWSIGGWNGWSNALGTITALKNSVHRDIRCYCIFDSDYHLEEERDERHRKAAEADIELHILKRKEIENYLVVPRLIRRLIERSIAHPLVAPTEEVISAKIDDIVDGMIGNVQDCYVAEFQNRDKAAGPKAASKKARDLINAIELEPNGRWHRVSGKDLVSKLSTWSTEEFGVSFGVATLLRALRRDDIDGELATLIEAMSEARALVRQ